MKKLLLLLLPLITTAQIPSYYDGINFNQTNNELKEDITALIIATHSNELTYTPEVWNALKLSDLDPENQENVFLIYGFDDNSTSKNHRTRNKNLSCHSSSCNGLWVREHVYPKSLGNPSFNTEGPGADAHAIRSADSQMNNSRSNRAFAQGKGNSHITSNGFFFPGDEWKGDVARMMMYMHLRYRDRCQANTVANSSNTYSSEMPDIFLEWNVDDPVSPYELVRNVILEERQGNRNPFIDNPYLATLIWGGEAAQNTWEELSLEEHMLVEKTKIYPNPSNGIFNISNTNINTISIFDLTGQLLFKTKESKINLINFKRGVYIVLIETKNKKSIVKKIIKN